MKRRLLAFPIVGAMIVGLGMFAVPSAPGQIMIPRTQIPQPAHTGDGDEWAAWRYAADAAESSNDFFYDLFAKLRSPAGSKAICSSPPTPSVLPLP